MFNRPDGVDTTGDRTAVRDLSKTGTVTLRKIQVLTYRSQNRLSCFNRESSLRFERNVKLKYAIGHNARYEEFQRSQAMERRTAMMNP